VCLDRQLALKMLQQRHSHQLVMVFCRLVTQADLGHQLSAPLIAVVVTARLLLCCQHL
jgi:hypothetical protein